MHSSRITSLALGLSLASALVLAPAPADAFCGFYVAGADANLYNNATLVVLMRDGTRTVLSMQNDYQGPPEDFALVIPVPVVLREGDVKTLPRAVFDRVDKLAAPRLVEYWEEDPCAPRMEYRKGFGGIPGGVPTPESAAPEQLGVKIEAQFEVGEYQVVILSAQDSTGLDTWLRQEKYNIPEGAQPLLEPYVQSGMKFFVAKVDAKKVKFENGRATLSPLRFHYDSEELSLPVRLGLINAQGPQDLLVHILARAQRYDVANYPKATIPTNLDVKELTKEQFGKFYVSLFDHTLAKTPRAVITEYAWAAGSCDPCPEPALTLAELITLGADVLPAYADSIGKPLAAQQELEGSLEWSVPNEFVLTRLHARYDADSLGEDLVFAAAPAIVGGREFMQTDGKLERGAREEPGGSDNFQARYIIRHPWTGAIACEKPERGIWGGPPDGAANQPKVAQQTAFEARDASLASFVTVEAGAQIGIASVEPPPPSPPSDAKDRDTADAKSPGDAKVAAKPEGAGGCACGLDDRASSFGGVWFGLLALVGLRRRKSA